VITPVSGSTTGYSGSITFNYYVYDPNCDTNTVWNGTECLPDYVTYCASLTPKYQQQLNNNQLQVSYNGSACVISY
jgi:hypothetical protein